MVVPLEAVGNCRLDEVLAKDNEIKQLLHREITDIRSTSERLQKDLDLKTTQLEKLKNDFIFNLRLIKERDSVISKLNEHVLCLTKNIHSRDILISEIKVCLDRTQSELAEAKSSEAKLREDIEDCMRETVKRERQLLEKHGTVIDVLRKTEIEERIKLQNTINRLQSELETEQLRSAADLQDALDNAKREKERLEADNSKKLFELELRLHVAEEATDLANKSKSEYMKELSCKNELLTGLNCQLNEANKTIQSKVLEIQDLQTHLKVSKQKQVLLESARMQDEESSKLQKTELLGEIDSLKAKLEHYEQEIAVNSTRHEETISSLKCENQRLLESLDQERQQTNKALDMWKEVKTKCQHAERKSRLAQAEVIRLTDDLKQALIKPELNVQEIVQCNHKDIINQIDYLQDTCDRLENENSRLKCTINMMSEQVKQVAQLTPEMITARTTTTDEKRNQQEEIKVHSKLLSAVKQIHQLALEKKALIELSNRLQAKLRQAVQNTNNYQQYERVNKRTLINDKRITLFKDEDTNVIPVSIVDKYATNMDLTNNSNTVIKNDQAKNNVNNEHVIDVNDVDSSSITGQRSFSTVFKLLDEAASLGDSENGVDITCRNGLVIHGIQKRITTPRPRL